MDKLKLIIKREYLNKVKNRTFVVMTFVSPLIFVAVAVVVGLLTSVNDDSVRKVAILDDTKEYQSLFEDTDRTNYIIIDNSLEQAIAASSTAQYYGLLHISKDASNGLGEINFYSDDTPKESFINNIEKRIEDKATNENLVASGINLKSLEEAQVDKTIKLQNYSGVQSSKKVGYVKMIFGGAAGYLLMMFIIIYGNMVMRSVIEEKTNRIIEIIVSSVKPIYLMMGKIIGTSLAGVTQFVIWVILGFVLYTIAIATLGIETVSGPSTDIAAQQLQDMSQMELILNDVFQLPLGTLIGCFFIYFIGGYLLYASIYTAIGAAVDNETDTQQFMLPIIIPLILAMYVGFFTVMDNPDGTVANVFSYIPLTSPIVMLMRIPFGVVSWWEIAVSLILLYLSIIAVAWLAAKIYRVGILMYGKKTNWKELYKWLKY